MTGTAILRGVVVPFAILALAFRIYLLAGESGSLGPLDLATAQWVLLGLWIAAPVVGGLASRALSDRQITRGAAILAAAIGLAVAGVFLTAAGFGSSCSSGAVGSAAGYVLGCLGVGAIVGIGVGASELITARLARRGWWLPAALLGGGLSFVASAGGVFLYYSIVTCLR